MRRLIKISLTNDELQGPLLRRPELDEGLAVDLYACVSQVLRRELSSRFSIVPSVVATALENLVEELSLEVNGVYNVTPEMAALAEKFRERGENTPVQMLKTLRRGQIAFFIALFADKLKLPADAAVRLIRKDGGQLFATACRSIGMMKSEFASIYLLSRPVRTEERVVDQKELASALQHYDTVRDADVRRLRQEWMENPAVI